MQPVYGTNRSQTCVAKTNVVNVRSQQIPFSCPSLLSQRENLNVVVKRQSSYQSQKCRDHATFSRSVDTPRYN